jgi:hypothetical protein
MIRQRNSLPKILKLSVASASAIRESELAAKVRSEGFTRRPRLGQAPPVRGIRPKAAQDVELDYVEDDFLPSDEPDNDGDADYHGAPGDADLDKSTAWSKRMATKTQNWEAKRNIHSSKLRQWSVFSPLQQETRIADRKQRLQESIDKAKHCHACCYLEELQAVLTMEAGVEPAAAAAAAAEDCMSVVSYRTVTYRFLEGSFRIGIPTVKCSLCGDVLEVCAVDCGCFGSSPVQPAEWYDLPLLDLYANLTFTAGLSATAFCTALNPIQGALCRDPDMDATEDISDMDDRYANLTTTSGLRAQ